MVTACHALKAGGANVRVIRRGRSKTSHPAQPPVLIVTGLAREMKLASGPGVASVTSGGSTQRLRELLEARMVPGCRAVLSFGIAGGLDPEMATGNVVVATGVVADGMRWPAHRAITDLLATTLRIGGVNARLADIAGVDAPLFDRDAKAAVRSETGAVAADMESHVASEFAARHGLAFAALRIICDPAASSLPAVVADALRPNGGVDHFAVLAGLLRQPNQAATLTRLAGEARMSFRVLGHCRDILGIKVGFPRLVEALGDIGVIGTTWPAAPPQSGQSAR
jgi:adenosylhomocysteine nucleosidase